MIRVNTRTLTILDRDGYGRERGIASPILERGECLPLDETMISYLRLEALKTTRSTLLRVPIGSLDCQRLLTSCPQLTESVEFEELEGLVLYVIRQVGNRYS